MRYRICSDMLQKTNVNIKSRMAKKSTKTYISSSVWRRRERLRRWLPHQCAFHPYYAEQNYCMQRMSWLLDSRSVETFLKMSERKGKYHVCAQAVTKGAKSCPSLSNYAWKMCRHFFQLRSSEPEFFCEMLRQFFFWRKKRRRIPDKA